nr:MAG TPA: hypothetical protein [Caudoviricetes sp.]
MLRYHIIQYMAMLLTKLVRIKQNPPLCLQSTPCGAQVFGKAGDFYTVKTAKSKIKSGTAHRQCHSLQRP